MILCDSEIKAALDSGQLVIDPRPAEEKITTTAVDLLLGGSDFKRWDLPSKGLDVAINPSEPDWFPAVASYLKPIPLVEGSVVVKPGDFILALTHERVELPEKSRLAARVEGKSSLARIGLGVHVTAPTIHAGFSGNITLEIKNHGDIPIRLCPGMAICQLIVEMVFGTPRSLMTGIFQNQTSVTGAGEA